jgi:O-succinylbenzoate synthase
VAAKKDSIKKRELNLMKVERIELNLIKLPYVHFFETSYGRDYEKTFILIKAFSGDVVGYGEVVADADPFYSYETISTAWLILKDYLVPLVLKKDVHDPEDLYKEAHKYRGHPMAKSGLELALWDLKAKELNLPLWKVYGGLKTEIPAGVSIGIQDSIPQLLERIHRFLEEGYQRIKVKIKPGWDNEILKEVRKEFPDISLQVDANGAYSLKDSDNLKGMDKFDLLMLEQPFPPYDLWDHSRLQKEIETPICLDESVISVETARKAYEMESCRIINIKVGRVGGISEARKIHDYCLEKGIPVWCGGMLESGIGRAHNLHLAALENFKYPNDLSASKRYYKQDLIDPPVEITEQGTILVPQSPGIGVFPQEDRIKKATVKKEIFKSAG